MASQAWYWYEGGMAVTVTQARSAGELLDLIAAGARPEYLLFWGHRPPPDGGTGTGCLSQWWPATFTIAGHTYPSAEHYMMTQKAVLSGDADTAGRIRRVPDPATAKRLGRQVTAFDEHLWAQHRFDVVVTGNLAKFSQNPDLRGFLLATGSTVLVEAAPHDQIWGIGLPASDERARHPRHWRGLNLLGFALMEVRSQLVTSQPAPRAGHG